VTSETRAQLRPDDSDELDADRSGTRPVADDDVDGLGEVDDDRTGDAEDGADDDRGPRRRGWLVPALAVLLVLLLAGAGYLWATRPAASPVSTADYVEVLQAARSEVVDLTSFDYQTIDDDIAQAKKISVGDLRSESVAQLQNSRQQLTDQQAVVSTQVVGAAVTKATSSSGTVLLVIESTQKTKASTQQQVVRYRIQADLTKTGGRWLLSGITGR
jgi:Mce-associated membrane protein